MYADYKRLLAVAPHWCLLSLVIHVVIVCTMYCMARGLCELHHLHHQACSTSSSERAIAFVWLLFESRMWPTP